MILVMERPMLYRMQTEMSLALTYDVDSRDVITFYAERLPGRTTIPHQALAHLLRFPCVEYLQDDGRLTLAMANGIAVYRQEGADDQHIAFALESWVPTA